jgi:glycosyltransferase involved in cell wall biosynthesis
MNILHVDINGWVYGVQKYVINLCKEMNKRGGYRSIVVGPSGEYLEKLRNEKIHVISLQERWKRIETEPKAWLKLYQIIKRERPSIIHSHGTKENIISKLLGPLLGIPVIPIYHCSYKRLEPNGSPAGLKRKIYQTIYLDILERSTAHLSAKNVAVSHSVKDNIRLFGIPEAKIRVIHSGIDMTDFEAREATSTRPNHKTKIVSIGRIDENKGVLDILQAAKILKVRNWNFEMYLVGNGPFLEVCKRLVGEYGLDNEIRFTGYLKNIREVLLSSDIFLSASYSEGFPLNVLEAMASGLPIVATNVGGVKELVHHKQDGLLVARGSYDQLAEALISLIKNDTLIGEYGRRGREKIRQKFEIKKMVSDFLILYRQHGIA